MYMYVYDMYLEALDTVQVINQNKCMHQNLRRGNWKLLIEYNIVKIAPSEVD